MSKFGVKDDISTGKNLLATGGGAVNSVTNLQKSAIITVYMTGDDIDQIDWLDIIGPHGEDKFRITKMDIKIYIGQHDNKVT